MNHRRLSNGLDRKQVNELHRGWEHAVRIGRPLNAMISLRPATAFCKLASRVRNKLGVWAKQRGILFVAAWARECNQDGTGEHLHVLMHVPPSTTPTSKKKLLDGFLNREPRMSDLRTSGSSSLKPAKGCRRSATSQSR
jgi:hypothetical protein